MSIKSVFKDYLPYSYMRNRRYNQKVDILKEQKEPMIYNSYGEIKRVFFLNDTLSQHTPYTFILGQNPEYILWDRHNVGLPIQFYTHEAMFGDINKYAKKKYGLLFESEAIRPSDFACVLENPEIMKKFDKVFTFSERILDKYENALFAPASGLWYGTEINGGELDATRYMRKDKNVSVVASNKQASEYHKLRVKVAKEAIASGLADGFGQFCNNRIEKKAEALERYRYSIVVENDVTDLYFTEKIMDCFASMTIPIYIGARKIGDYFNTDGIIMIKPEEYDSIESVLRGCSEEDYNSRLNAIKDNFERVKKYRCIEDYIYTNYREEFQI